MRNTAYARRRPARRRDRRLGRALAEPFARRILNWSSYVVVTEPIPERLAEIGWTGGEGIADARFTLHYGRPTADGRIALGGGGGRRGLGRPDRTGVHERHGSARRAAVGLRRWFPTLADVRIEDAWGGPIDITDDHRPWFTTLPGGAVHLGVEVFGERRRAVDPGAAGSSPRSSTAGRGRRGPEPADRRAEGDAAGVPAGAVRGLGARVFREATTRREAAEEAGRTPAGSYASSRGSRGGSATTSGPSDGDARRRRTSMTA